MSLRLFSSVSAICLFLLPGSTARAQDRIDLYSDSNRSSCEITDNSSSTLVHIYAFLTGPVAANGVRFKAPVPACWQGATWVGDTLPDAQHLSIGDSQGDWSVVFYTPTGGCLPATPIHVGTINIIATGAAPSCCDMIVMPPTPYPFEFSDCSFAAHPLAAGQKIVVNPNDSCRCQSPLAVEPSTWGRVKSLYR